MAFSNRPYNPSVDYFAVLGVHHQACKKTVKTAYRRLARRYHPDVSTIHDAKEKFQEISEAYEVLSKHRDSYWREFQLSVRNRTSRSGFKWSRSSDSRSQRSTTQNRKSRQSHRSYRAYQPIDGKDRCITYPLTLRYAIRLLKLGSFYIPGLKVKMKFTCEALQGKTFRLAGKGYKGLYGGKPGDFLVRFEIKNEKIQWELKGSDIYGTFKVTPDLLNAGCEIKLESPSGVCSVEVPHGYCSEQFLCIKNMGLPSCVSGVSGHLYARLVAA